MLIRSISISSLPPSGSFGAVSRVANNRSCLASNRPSRGLKPCVVDMASSNAWAEFATIFTLTHQAHLERERAKAELKSLMPEDAKEASGHGVRAKRSKSGAISFDLLTAGASHAAV
jgi:hypothetical protein